MFKNGRWPFLDRVQELYEDDPTRLLIKGEVVAIASPGTRSGDILVSLHTGDNGSDQADACYIGLIMREEAQFSKFRIVGQAFLHPSLSPCYGTDWQPGCDYCLGGNEPALGGLQIVFSIFEWTLLMSRFLVPGTSTVSEQLNTAMARLYSQSYATIVESYRTLVSNDGANSDGVTTCDWSSVTMTEAVTND